MKKRFSAIVPLLILLAGLALLLYPAVSSYWNSLHQSQAVAAYSQQVEALQADRYQEIRQAAQLYNQSLEQPQQTFLLSPEQQAQYLEQLNIGQSGIMGYVEIPSIDVRLPIYHGTDPAVLQVAIGHLEWSSLPVGGPGSHCVISGHRGLPSAVLFSHLDRLVPGDVFSLRVLDEILSYRVDQILIVEPHEIQPLLIQSGEDLCTLVTCTPYAVNSHRLLVRGHRIETENPAAILVASDAAQLAPPAVAAALAAPVLLILLAVLLFPGKKR